MSSPVVPQKVYFTGENSFLCLKTEEGGAETTTCTHWRGLISPAGPGHVLFLKSDATDGEIRAYTDNEGFARFIQTIEETLHPDSFADKNLPLIAAKFSNSGDIGSTFIETISSAEGDITMSWSDMGEPFMLAAAPGSGVVGDWGVYSCLTPAGTATLDVAGRRAAGKTYPNEMASHPSGMSCLAWSETWVR
jgi:hypothetical protein